MDYSPLPSENLASPAPSEYFDFTQLFLCFPSDCAVRIENPSVFFKTNKQTKNNNENKTIATTKVSLRSKRLSGVWEQRKTEERDFRCFCRAKIGARAKKRKRGVGEGKEGTAWSDEGLTLETSALCSFVFKCGSVPAYSLDYLFSSEITIIFACHKNHINLTLSAGTLGHKRRIQLKLEI